VVSEGVNRAKENTEVGIMLITHYTRIPRENVRFHNGIPRLSALPIQL
jgi:Fe-S cluster assembly ATPase SufC